MKYCTISSGIECHSLASTGLGDEAIFFSEINPAPISVLHHWWPKVPNLGDMTRIDFDSEKGVIHNHKYKGYELVSESVLGFKPADVNDIEIPCKYGEIELISGGTPCTDMSVAGKRQGAAEGSNTRSALQFQLPRIGEALGTRWIMWENVPGAFSSNGGKDFLWFLHRCTEAGYTIAWRTLDAQFTRSDTHPRAVPQRRRRVWMVGYRGTDWRIPAEVLFEPMKVLGNQPPVRTVGKGFLAANPDYDPNAVVPSAAEDLKDFLSWANPDIIKTLIDKGICDDPAKRLNDLLAEENKDSAVAAGDLFGGDLFGAPEPPSHQGAKLRAADLALDFPPCPDIRSVPQYELFQWAKTVCSEIGYCGEMFKKNGGNPNVDDLDPRPLTNIGNAGILSDGIIVTMKMPEWNAGVTVEDLATMSPELRDIYDGDMCGLSDILEDVVDPKFKLSWRACWGICNRAKNRGKRLPVELGYALVDRIIDQARFVKWTAINGKDTKKKETDRTEREVAQLCYDDFIATAIPFSDCPSEQPRKSVQEEEDETLATDIEDAAVNGEDEESGEEMTLQRSIAVRSPAIQPGGGFATAPLTPMGGGGYRRASLSTESQREASDSSTLPVDTSSSTGAWHVGLQTKLPDRGGYECAPSLIRTNGVEPPAVITITRT